MWLSLKSWLFPVSLGLSLCVAVFCYGFAVSQFKIFPYSVLRQSRSAFVALVGLRAPPEVNGLATYRLEVTESTVVPHSGSNPEGLILLCAGGNALKPNVPNGALAWIIDRSGEILHLWENQPTLWDDLELVTRVTGISGAINPFGLHLFDNGDLLATFHGFNTFPFAVGMARFDRDSNLLWKKELLTHHSFSVAPDGRIFVPALEVVDAPLRIGETFASIESDTGKVVHDLILVLDRDGNELQRISLKDALFNSGWRGHLIRGNAETVQSDDPFHLNDVHLVGEHAAHLPGISPDDLLVSMRNINTIGILDPRTERFKWTSCGATVGQHSPRLLRDAVVALDNLGGDRRLGGTQLVRIDFRTGQPSSLFPRANVEMPDLCRTVNSGHLEIHPSEQYALMTLTHEGAVWEIDVDTGQVVWEYIHVQLDDRNKPQRIVGSARYIDQPVWLAN